MKRWRRQSNGICGVGFSNKHLHPGPPAPIFLIVSQICFLGGLAVHRLEIIIPTWNGRSILAECLPAVLDCVDELDPPAKITVVDDASTDGTLEYLAKHWPQVNVLPLWPHRGFPGAVNAAAFVSAADVLMLLNNDMIPNGPVLRPLLEHFADREVAAVSARVLKWDRKTIDVGRRVRTFENGEIRGVGHNEDHPEVSATFFACGGAMAVSRRKFVELDGFDEIYSPGYVEDTDFCYRAWKRGWKIVWDPRSTFIHMGSATFAPKTPGLKRHLGRLKVRYLLHRNAFCFYWKNLTDPQMRRDYWKHLPGRALNALLSGDVLYFAAFLRALTRFRQLSRRRHKELQMARLSDAEVFAKLEELCRSKQIREEKHVEQACIEC